MYVHPSDDKNPFDWQNPEFLKGLDRSLLPRSQRRPSPKPPKKEKERLYKQVTRRTVQY